MCFLRKWLPLRIASTVVTADTNVLACQANFSFHRLHSTPHPSAEKSASLAMCVTVVTTMLNPSEAWNPFIYNLDEKTDFLSSRRIEKLITSILPVALQTLHAPVAASLTDVYLIKDLTLTASL